MSLHLSFSFPASSVATVLVGSGFKVQRYELRESMSALFELKIEVLSTDPAIDMGAVVGQYLAVRFDDEPFLNERRGIVRHAAQLSSVPTGDSRYEWIIVPPLWFTTQRRDTRIFQNLTTAQILAQVLADPSYGGRIPAAVAQLAGNETPREYCVQYGETDHDFIFRLLAEDGIASFFDHANGSAFTLVANTAATVDAVGGPVPFSDPSNLNPILAKDPTAPRISAVTFATGLATSATTIRSWDFERPALVLEEKGAALATRLFPHEAALEAYSFEPGIIDRSPAAGQRAAERLQSLRTSARTFDCEASFTLPAGAGFTLADHPRADLNLDLVVVGAVTVVDFGSVATRTLTCIDRRELFLPAQRHKPRIHGTQSAIVVGAAGQEIDVDKLGRVQVEFHWDRRGLHVGTTRRVRVSQSWAGAGFGFVMLPRVGDEVLVTYLDGDPDEPVIVGRLHNAASTSPLHLPAEKTQSVWRSKSSPGGDGFNEIRMDDLAGAETLSLHAQRDFQAVTGRNASTAVGVDQSLTVGGVQRSLIRGAQRTGVAGGVETHASFIELHGTDYFQAETPGDMYLDAGGNQEVAAGCNYHIRSNSTYVESHDVVQISAPTIHLFGGTEIHLQVGASSIHITDGEVKIVSPLINLNP